MPQGSGSTLVALHGSAWRLAAVLPTSPRPWDQDLSGSGMQGTMGAPFLRPPPTTAEWENEHLRSSMAHQTNCAFDHVRHLDTRNTLRDLPLGRIQTRVSTILRQQKALGEAIKGVSTRTGQTLDDASRHPIGMLLQGLCHTAISCRPGLVGIFRVIRNGICTRRSHE